MEIGDIDWYWSPAQGVQSQMKASWLLLAVVACGQLFGQARAISIAENSRRVTGANGAPADHSDHRPSGGYVVGNFGISAQISDDNGPRAFIKVNPPKLGVWLQNFAQGELWVREDGQSARRLRLSPIK